MPHSTINPVLRRFAKANRKAPTKGERLIWAYLRAFNRRGAAFRREAPIGPFVMDFAWLSGRLVVEVDGASHDLPGRVDADRGREAFLVSRGFQVVRLRDADVIANEGAAFTSLEWAILSRLSLSRDPTPSPSPQGGGGSLWTGAATCEGGHP